MNKAHIPHGYNSIETAAYVLAAEYKGNKFDPADPIAWDYFRDWVDDRSGKHLNYPVLNALTTATARRIARR